MLHEGRWKLNTYVGLGFAPEQFDLIAESEETTNLATDPTHAKVMTELSADLIKIVDPEAVNSLAFEDQAALIVHHGGKDAALKLGASARNKKLSFS